MDGEGRGGEEASGTKKNRPPAWRNLRRDYCCAACTQEHCPSLGHRKSPEDDELTEDPVPWGASFALAKRPPCLDKETPQLVVVVPPPSVLPLSLSERHARLNDF